MKHLAFITAVAGLGMSVQAPAQIYESAFKDTNGIEIHAPSSRLMLNPASPVTLTLISGLDRFVNVKVTKDTGTTAAWRLQIENRPGSSCCCRTPRRICML